MSIRSRLTTWRSSLGPGFVTGATSNDPSSIGTYVQTGALFGLRQLWTVIYTYPLIGVVQEVCARIGFATKRGLAGAIRLYYPRWVACIAALLLTGANVINIGADIAAMSEALQLFGSRVPYMALTAGAMLFTLWWTIYVSYTTYERYLLLMACVLFAYIPTMTLASLDWTSVVYSSFIPTLSFDRTFLVNMVAVFGTTISPYMFFWQSYHESEACTHNIARTRDNIITDTWFSMGFSNLISWCIIATGAHTFHANGVFFVHNAAEAAQALTPFIGEWATYLFALAMIGTALIAIPVFALTAAQSWCEVFDQPARLAHSFKQAPVFYTVFAVCICVGGLLSVFPISVFELLYYAAIANGFLAVPLLWFLATIADDPDILGEHRVGRSYILLTYCTAGVMTLTVVLLIINHVWWHVL